MARVMLRYVVFDAGGPIQNAKVTMFRPGTSTPPYGSVYDAPIAGTTTNLSHILTSNDKGEVKAWLDTPQRVDLRVSDNGAVAYHPTASTVPLSWPAYTVPDIEMPAAVETAPELFSARAFGVTGTGDDGPAMQAALTAASGGLLVCPPGVIRTSIPLAMGESGSGILGSGIGNNGTIIRPTTGAGLGPLLTIGSTMNRLENIRLEGSGDATRGILIRGGWHSSLDHVVVRAMTGDGIVLDSVPALNANNEIGMANVHLENNGGSGLTIGPDSTDQHDNDGLSLLNCTATGNGQHGIAYSGVGLKVLGGNYLENGIGASGYGIKIGRVGDASGHRSRAAYLFGPWVEGNGNGAADHGVVFAYAFGCVFHHQYGQTSPPQQGVDWANSEKENLEITQSATGAYVLSNLLDTTARSTAIFVSAFTPPRDNEWPATTPPVNGTIAIAADGTIHRRKAGTWGPG